MTTHEKGRAAESQACDHLSAQGYQILARNYRVQGAEIDIIAMHESTIAFIEVRARASIRNGTPRETVTPAKQRRICMAALCYLQSENLSEAAVRFDIIEILPEGLSHLRDAFPYMA